LKKKTKKRKSGMELGLEWLSEQLGRKVTVAEVFGAAMDLKLQDEKDEALPPKEGK